MFPKALYDAGETGWFPQHAGHALYDVFLAPMRLCGSKRMVIHSYVWAQITGSAVSLDLLDFDHDFSKLRPSELIV